MLLCFVGSVGGACGTWTSKLSIFSNLKIKPTNLQTTIISRLFRDPKFDQLKQAYRNPCHHHRDTILGMESDDQAKEHI